jgi:glutamate racemase
VNTAPIGIFDSGVGGLSILQEVRIQYPAEDLIYIADQAHVPYGPRPIKQVRSISKEISRFLIACEAKIVIVACNTASAAALYTLRKIYPSTPFVGMEPAVKPAAENTHTGIVGVLATPATFQSELFASVLDRFADGVTVIQDTCPGLVSRIEEGDLDSSKTRQILKNALTPMIHQGVDQVVIGCTHYPHVSPLIKEIVGANVEIIDPSQAVARQTGRILRANQLLNPGKNPGKVQFFTSGDPKAFANILAKLVGEKESVEGLEWERGLLKRP